MGIFIFILLVAAFILTLLGGFKYAHPSRDLGWLGISLFIIAFVLMNAHALIYSR